MSRRFESEAGPTFTNNKQAVLLLFFTVPAVVVIVQSNVKDYPRNTISLTDDGGAVAKLFIHQ